MSVSDVISRRGIESVMHFTTTDGFLGMVSLDPPSVLSRLALMEQGYTKFLPCENADFRPDKDWLDYINLSITNINRYFYRCSKRSHKDSKWIILEFSPEILTHDGVLFVTTNNIYRAATRAGGEAGLEALFAPQFNNGKRDLNRAILGLPANAPTCNQAEVLYPRALSLEYLKKIYVLDESSSHLISAQAITCGGRAFDVVISSEPFDV